METLLDKLSTELFGKEQSGSVARIVIVYFFGSASKQSVLTYRLAKALHDTGRRRLGRILFRRLQSKFGIYISPKAEIGTGLRFPHPNGIVIGEGVKAGRDLTIYQQVTIGGARKGDAQANRYPTIGHSCILFAGCKIIGHLSVGNECCIGTNAVLLSDLPNRSTAVGVPARSIPPSSDITTNSRQDTPE